MKSEYKYIEFKSTGSNIISCVNKTTGGYLGRVSFYKPWKKYVFEYINKDSVFDSSCLRDIADFLDQLNG